MNREKWSEVRRRGMLRYVLRVGLFHIGFVSGFIWVTLKYWADSDFIFSNMSINDFYHDYAPWILLSVLIGVFSSILLWTWYEDKFLNSKFIE